ncbi:hypothetical protein [Chryseobacterium lactis]|uniref:hypothetical protein n=1 Tax=Chryseobacterium lactis TaxID=1241981 RepID=UPI00162488E9|nr:hypothetical protein [Chryseobacterium lactis]
MNTENLINKVVSITLKSKAYFQGIVIDISDDWCYLKYIPVDYMTDGYVIINKRYIAGIEITEEEQFKERILQLKGVISVKSPILTLDDNEKLLADLQSKIGIIRVEIKDHHRAFIGKINSIRKHSFRVHLFSPSAVWLQLETFLYKEIRAIYFEEDYINSLKLILPPYPSDTE